MCDCKTQMKIHVCAKCSDLCGVQTFTPDGKEDLNFYGYVPHFLGPGGWGDYVIMDICANCGKIQNWEKQTRETVYNSYDHDTDDENIETADSLISIGEDNAKSLADSKIILTQSVIETASQTPSQAPSQAPSLTDSDKQ